MLRVLESKAAAGDVAIGVTSTAMRICGGAAFSKHLSIERLFRDAHAGAVMAPTGDVLREFIGKVAVGNTAVLKLRVGWPILRDLRRVGVVRLARMPLTRTVEAYE